MTKVQLLYDLTQPLNEALLNRIADIHGVYGMTRVQITPSQDQLTVEWDASRLTLPQVEATLHRFGLPVRRREA